MTAQRTDEQARADARAAYGSDQIEIDADARVIQLDEEGVAQGAAWVQAWVYLDPVEDHATPKEG